MPLIQEQTLRGKPACSAASIIAAGFGAAMNRLFRSIGVSPAA